MKEKIEKDMFSVNDSTFNEVVRGIYGEVGRMLVEKTDVMDKIAQYLKLKVKPEPAYKSKFEVGNVVKIKDGPWKEFVGTVISVNEAKGQLKVMLSLFNRDTPVDNIDFLQVEKYIQVTPEFNYGYRKR